LNIMFNSFSEAVSLSITKETEVFEEGKQSLHVTYITFLACFSFIISYTKIVTYKPGSGVSMGGAAENIWT